MMLSLPAQAQASDYSAGYAQGQMDAQTHGGSQAEWACYGACATCLVGAPGCVGVTLAGALVDPEVIPPLAGGAQVPSAQTGTLPPAPDGVQQPQRWQEGYEAGWDDATQDKRKRMALVGGGVSAGLMVVAVATYYGLVGVALLATL